jgi:acetyl esterase/lipase
MARSLRLRLLNLFLRLTVKPALGWARRPEAVRAQFEANARRLFRPPEDANFVPDTIRREGGGMMQALWASRGRPDRHRVILYLHGGAYIMGSPRTHRHLGARLAGAAEARALLPDYRLAPEHRFPAALEDALTAYRHLLASGHEGARIALAGDSAGGGLAFALLLRLAQERLPRPACVVAFSPWADLTMTRPSLAGNARRDVMLPVGRFREVIALYLGEALSTDPLASPALGTFASPPPAMITASKDEVLRDDAVAVAERLREAGGDVTLELWRGMPHGWPIFAGLVREADETVTRAGRFIARHMGACAASGA